MAQGQYDPIGLLSSLLVQLKMLMRDVCNEEGEVKAISWDAEVPPHISERLHEIIGNLAELRQITFPRSMQPSLPTRIAPWLLVFGDGSREAYCATAYAR